MNKKMIISALSVALLSGGVLGYQSLVQAAAPNKVTTQASQGVKLDQKLMQQAQAKLKELTGNTYKLVQAEAMKGFVNFQRENFKLDSIMYKNSGELETILINILYEDLNGGKYQTSLENTWKTLFPGETPKYVQISESIYRVGTISSNAKQDKQIYLDVNGMAYGVDYAPEAAPASVEQAAVQALSKLTGGKVAKGAELDRVFVREGKPNVYRYSYKSKAMDVIFSIEEGTPELLQVEVYQSGKDKEKAKELTMDTIMKNATKAAKKMINFDLNGYTAARGANSWDGDLLTFTKEGAPTVIATMNPDGSFSSFEVKKYGQSINFYSNTIVGAPNEESKLLINQ